MSYSNWLSFIEKYKDLINSNSFEKLYDKVVIERGINNIPKFTSLLLEANINPLNYMSYIPPYFLLKTYVQNITIPSHIEKILHQSFYNCSNLEEIILPDSIKTIGMDAFCLCKNLKYIELNKNIQLIGHCAFKDISTNAKIIYKGTKEEFDKISIYNDSFEYPAKISCLDGEIIFS